MVLPIDAIVPIYYSASVNIASTNNQSLHIISQNPSQLIYNIQERALKNIDKRLIQHLNNVFEYPLFQEFIGLQERVQIKVIRSAIRIYAHIFN